MGGYLRSSNRAVASLGIGCSSTKTAFAAHLFYDNLPSREDGPCKNFSIFVLGFHSSKKIFMLEYISGKVEELTPASVVIACNVIGYWINISLSTYSALSLGKQFKMYIYAAIREDAFVLYGF